MLSFAILYSSAVVMSGTLVDNAVIGVEVGLPQGASGACPAAVAAIDTSNGAGATATVPGATPAGDHWLLASVDADSVDITLDGPLSIDGTLADGRPFHVTLPMDYLELPLAGGTAMGHLILRLGDADWLQPLVHSMDAGGTGVVDAADPLAIVLAAELLGSSSVWVDLDGDRVADSRLP